MSSTNAKSDDRRKLESLRRSVACIAHALGIEGVVSPDDAVWSAGNLEEGWNTMAGLCVEQIERAAREAERGIERTP